MNYLMYIRDMKLPTIIVNFKLYEQSTGDAAVELAKIHERVAEETGASIGIAVTAVDLCAVVSTVEIPVFAQHVDDVGYGGYTGHVSPMQIKELGGYGTLINHAENSLETSVLEKTIRRAKEAGLYVISCADTAEKGAEILEFKPDLVAVEPPDLIGGDISVSKAGPHIIEDAVRLVGRNRLLVGAGVKDSEDVEIALSLGACGVLLASGVVKSEDPYLALMDLVSGLR